MTNLLDLPPLAVDRVGVLALASIWQWRQAPFVMAGELHSLSWPSVWAGECFALLCNHASSVHVWLWLGHQNVSCTRYQLVYPKGLTSSTQDTQNFPPSPLEKWRVWAAEKQQSLLSVGRDIWKQRCFCTASLGCTHACSTQVQEKSERLTLDNPVPCPDIVSRIDD